MIAFAKDYLRDRIYACWIGKNIGGTLGTPYEGTHDLLDIQGFASKAGEPLPNDDLDLQLAWLRAVDELGPQNITSKALAEYWLSYITPNWNEYGIGKANLRAGLPAPLSGWVNNEEWRNSNGAWIRTEVWACLYPALVEKAIRFAYEDASVDHGLGEGTWAAIFVAAMESAAFAISDIPALIDIGLGKIPEDCRVARSVRLVVDAYRKGTPWQEVRQALQLTDKQLMQDKIEVPAYRMLYLDEALQENAMMEVIRDVSFASRIEKLQNPDFEKDYVPDSLKGILREYQKAGAAWIGTLYSNRFGGILADDMGLGKTLQVISFLLTEHTGCSLIVCPASLVYNWKHELERFAPSLKADMVTGNVQQRKEVLDRWKEVDVLITSYDLLRRDITDYQELHFFCEVIDEAQYIKNHGTQAARAVKQVQTGFRLALTGTPIENRLSELWSIFDYLMPGYLYSYQRFRTELEQPIVQHKDEDAAKRLQRLIRPFVLRRLKKEVLQDLPDKLEENLYADMDGEQQELYDAHVRRMKLMLEEKSDEEIRTDKIEILAELTRLRQLCCDPALLYDNYKGGSAKTELVRGLIRNAVENGHKVLLFSQFTTMLERLYRILEEEKIASHMLTGATPKEKRIEMVESFAHDEVPVFCISLKAGGTGLNLTAADVVIHFDPWWNSAVQNQATDRAHRIGQKNVVNVYRILAKGTIEEKIVELQERKLQLSDRILGGESLQAQGLTREELLELLR